jgi:diguanylate cyclase (GGDEF)-like protein
LLQLELGGTGIPERGGAIRKGAVTGIARTRSASDVASDSFFDLPGVLVATLGTDGRILRLGAGWASLGYAQTELLRHRLFELIHPDVLPETLSRYRTLRAPGSVTFVGRCCTADGGYRWLRWSAVSDGETVTALAVDIGEQRTAQAELAERALRDPLTALPNRAVFVDRVDYALAQLARTDTHVAVILFDIDDFHVMNDSFTRAGGDRVLIVAAVRLCNAVRGSDTVARVGADEFGVLCSDTNEGAVLEIAERLAGAVAAPLTFRGRTLALSVSAGVAIEGKPRLGEMLVADAEVALHRATATGARGIEFFDRELRAESARRLELRVALQGAAERGELTLVYLPVVQLGSGEALAFEALVRWNHPERGLLSPGDFIPMAEETGLITEVGTWVLEAACAEAAGWAKMNGGKAPAVAVNVSRRQLGDPDFVYTVAQALERAQLEPARLWLEVTESAVLADLDGSLATLTALDGFGVEIAIDDFGEGQSSLSQLVALTPVSILKIGTPLTVHVTEHGSRGRAVVEALLQLGDAIGLRLVVEGVETEAQLHALEELGCPAAQGYHFERPQPVAALGRWLAQI